MSKEQWKKMKEQEKNKNKGKNLGKSGITTFKSRSFADWQKAGGINLFPGKLSKVAHVFTSFAFFYKMQRFQRRYFFDEL